jgi:NADPH:quinone reductase-like Zn-dependent oxidoreductase
MTFKQASTIPSRAILALQGLGGKRPLKKGQKVLINGAGGGVGHFAVQLAKYFGAQITAVDHTEKLDFLHSLGADFVIDYTKENFTKNGQRYDLILDIAGKHSVFSYRRSLSSNGLYIMVGGSRSSIFQVVFLGYLLSLFGSKKMGLVPWKPNKKEDLNFLKTLIESKKIAPVIDRCFPLNEVAEALRYFDEGFPKGKIVITVRDEKT